MEEGRSLVKWPQSNKFRFQSWTFLKSFKSSRGANHLQRWQLISNHQEWPARHTSKSLRIIAWTRCATKCSLYWMVLLPITTIMLWRHAGVALDFRSAPAPPSSNRRQNNSHLSRIQPAQNSYLLNQRSQEVQEHQQHSNADTCQLTKWWRRREPRSFL